MRVLYGIRILYDESSCGEYVTYDSDAVDADESNATEATRKRWNKKESNQQRNA